jgi:hypothetical protein
VSPFCGHVHKTCGTYAVSKFTFSLNPVDLPLPTNFLPLAHLLAGDVHTKRAWREKTFLGDEGYEADKTDTLYVKAVTFVSGTLLADLKPETILEFQNDKWGNESYPGSIYPYCIQRNPCILLKDNPAFLNASIWKLYKPNNECIVPIVDVITQDVMVVRPHGYAPGRMWGYSMTDRYSGGFNEFLIEEKSIYVHKKEEPEPIL